ncbi:MAG: carboxypeptidase-like regulatory domain-containing protein, partial [Cyclobacteriaceae bacterium]|nr:carboxypeptidase-like regulatory domain-containing protein [Cyclobacteriaceae bacterium]
MKKFYLKSWLMLSFLLGLTFLVQAQQAIQISGKVTDENTGESIPGVNVLIIGTSVGTATDLDGNFTISANQGDRLRFSFIGYAAYEVVLANQTRLDVALRLDSQNLNEVLVIGFGEQSRETLTSAVSKVDKRVLENVPFANAASALQ